MCTVLQQHLNQSNGFAAAELSSSNPGSPRPPSSSSKQQQQQQQRQQTLLQYSYLQDDHLPNLKRPIDPYDRKCHTPVMHFHMPETKGSQRGRQQQQNSYMQQLLGRRSRSHSRTGMRVLVEQMQASAPRARSPHMNNEEPINLSHYPDGRAPPPEGRITPIERDDFPAPPYNYGGSRRRHWSEPGREDSLGSITPAESSSGEEDEVEVVDEKLDRTEQELKKIANGGMGKVFLQEIAVERERRKQSKSRLVDPRSAARTPTAKKEPHFRLRYDSPLNASPSRIADHLRPWDDVDAVDGGTASRRSNVATPFLPHTMPSQHPLRVVSPVNPIRPGYTQRAQTLPLRFSPGYESDHLGSGHDKTYSTDYSSNKSDADLSSSYTQKQQQIRVSTTYTQGLQAATPRGVSITNGGGQQHMGSLPNMSSSMVLQAPNIYPLHLLFTTNYRLPGDVDRCNLEKHLSDAEFDMVFRMSRDDFYKIPYWKRCDMKRKYHLF